MQKQNSNTNKEFLSPSKTKTKTSEPTKTLTQINPLSRLSRVSHKDEEKKLPTTATATSPPKKRMDFMKKMKLNDKELLSRFSQRISQKSDASDRKLSSSLK
jgi:hypothetical protein